MVHGEGLGDDGAEALVNVPLHLAGGAVAWLEASSVCAGDGRGWGEVEAIAQMAVHARAWDATSNACEPAPFSPPPSTDIVCCVCAELTAKAVPQ